ncbi:MULTISPECIES: IPT/TIG domain-containing protein [unclassified Serratia (in: enterobacteria)]|uniref:IPT/TIG domain-containing protein n=1 Tax=unclassified Serratia (in: enterobacteria) TaxID=2647522 RepID=UPI003076080D
MAQTVLQGSLTENTSLSRDKSPYLVEGELLLQNGAQLEIEAGVTLYMGGNARLNVISGSVKIRGTQEYPVRVISDKVRQGLSPAPGDWDQWIFSAGTVATHLDHVVFEHGHGLAVYGSSPVFNYLTLRHHQGAAITIDLKASPSGIGNVASHNTVNGIAVPSGDIVTDVNWTLEGLPYVITAGDVSVGQSPALFSVIPNTVEQGETVTLTVTGQQLQGIDSATFDRPGLTLLPLPGASAHSAAFQLTVAPTASSGPATLQLQLDAGNVTLPDALTVGPALLALESLQPSTIEANAGSVPLTVIGRHFTSQSELLMEGQVLPATYISTTTLQTTLPNQPAAGSLSMQVRTPSVGKPGDFILSNILMLNVTKAALPVITIVPRPIEYAPDGQAHPLTLSLSKPAPTPYNLSLKSSAPHVVSVEPSTLTIHPGETQATFTLTPHTLGSAILSIESPPLSKVTENVLVSMDIARARTGFAPAVGIRVGKASLPQLATPFDAIHAPSVGLRVGQRSLPQSAVKTDATHARPVGIRVGMRNLPQPAVQTDTARAQPIGILVGKRTRPQPPIQTSTEHAQPLGILVGKRTRPLSVTQPDTRDFQPMQ